MADHDTATEVATTGGWTLALAADAAGCIYACDPTKQYVWRLDLEDWQPEVFTAGAPGEMPGLATIAVHNIGRWHVTRFRVPGGAGVPLSYPKAQHLGP